MFDKYILNTSDTSNSFYPDICNCILLLFSIKIESEPGFNEVVTAFSIFEGLNISFSMKWHKNRKFELKVTFSHIFIIWNDLH